MSRHHPVRAAFWMLGTVAGLSAMTVAGREVSAGLDTFEIMTYRSVIGIAIMAGAATLLGRWGEVRTQRFSLHLIRNISHFAGQNLWFFALTLLPLAQVVALEFSTPIWVILAAPLLVGERMTVARLGAGIVGFAGVLVVARPDFGAVNIGVVAAAASAIGFAGSILATKRLTRTETVLCILFWLTLIQAVLGLAGALLDGQIALPAATAWPWLVVIGVSGLGAHFCLTTALSLAPATVTVPFDFLRLPLTAALGAVIYAETLEPSIGIGAAMIFGANYVNVLVEARARRRRAVA